MSDEQTPTAVGAEEVKPPQDRPEENAYGEERRKRLRAEQQLQEMQSRIEELENRDKSELERERGKREQFERQAAEMSARLQRVERSGWIRSAAAAAGFDDPDDAVAFISTDSVESDADAEKAVAKLAKRKPRLLRDQTPALSIGQVVQNGQPVQPGGQQQQEVDPAAVALLEQVKAAQASGWTSTPIQ